MKKTEQRWMRESNGYVAEREFTPNPMTIKEFKQWWNRFEYSGNYPEPKTEHINLLLAELTRLTADLAEAKAYKDVIDEALIVSCIGVASGDARADLHKLLVWEIDVALDPQVSKRAAGLLAEKDAEIERGKTYKKTHSEECKMMFAEIGAKLQAAESLAASRLADQDAIERHVTKRVAGEILLIMDGSESYEDAVSEIRNQYGV